MNPVHQAAPRARRALLTRTLALAWAAGMPVLAVAQQACPPPVAIPANLLTTQTPWDSVGSYLQKGSFVAPDTKTVSPCYMSQGQGKDSIPCAKMTATIRSEAQAYCFTQQMAQDPSQAYVLGQVTWEAGKKWSQLGFGSQNPSNVVYLAVIAGQGVTLFQDKSNTVGIKAGQQGWRFSMHSDGPYTQPQAAWRPDSQNPHGTAMAQLPAGPAGVLPDDSDAAQDGASYGWMACAPGCCQFHGTSGGVGDGDEDDDDDEQGGHGHPGNGHGHGGGPGGGSRTRMTVSKERTPGAE